MKDTSAEFDRIVRARYAAMSPLERMEIVGSLRRAAVAIIESSLPVGLSLEERRYAVAKRLYGDEVSEQALLAHARFAPRHLSSRVKDVEKGHV
jgi:hypothetical protein